MSPEVIVAGADYDLDLVDNSFEKQAILGYFQLNLQKSTQDQNIKGNQNETNVRIFKNKDIKSFSMKPKYRLVGTGTVPNRACSYFAD
jgi:hypothetical protein